MARLFGRKEEIKAEPVIEAKRDEEKAETGQSEGSIREIEINLSLLNEKLNVIINLLVKQDQLLSKAMEEEKK